MKRIFEMLVVLVVWLTLPLLVWLTLPAFSGESPGQIDEATKKEVREKIRDYVKHEVQLKGAFLILDPRNEDPLVLEYDHVHDGVDLIDGAYAACVDFKDRQGTIYDVDVTIRMPLDDMTVQDVLVHKVAGERIRLAKPE